MPIIILSGKPVQYDLAPNPRRQRMGVEITAEGGVVVRTPALTAPPLVEAFLRQPEVTQWLLDALARQSGEAPTDGLRQVSDEYGPLEYRLNRKRGRRRVTLFVHRDATLEVRAPHSATIREIEDFVRSKLQWAREKLAETETAVTPEREWVSGETLLFHGDPRTLQVDTGLFEGTRVELRGKTLRVQIGPAPDENTRRHRVRHAVRRWLIDRALEETKERLPKWADKGGVKFSRASIKDTRSRWGSCSHRGNLSISYRIVMARPDAMDYLFVHELCHLIHPNHSDAYWAEVARVLPDHKRRRKWLRQHEGQLVV